MKWICRSRNWWRRKVRLSKKSAHKYSTVTGNAAVYHNKQWSVLCFYTSIYTHHFSLTTFLVPAYRKCFRSPKDNLQDRAPRQSCPQHHPHSLISSFVLNSTFVVCITKNHALCALFLSSWKGFDLCTVYLVWSRWWSGKMWRTTLRAFQPSLITAFEPRMPIASGRAKLGSVCIEARVF